MSDPVEVSPEVPVDVPVLQPVSEPAPEPAPEPASPTPEPVAAAPAEPETDGAKLRQLLKQVGVNAVSSETLAQIYAVAARL